MSIITVVCSSKGHQREFNQGWRKLLTEGEVAKYWYMRDIFIKEIRQAVTIYTGDVRPKTCAPLKTDAFDFAEPPNNFDAYDVGQHNHASSDEVIRQQLLINEMKENIRDNPSTPLRRVYDQSVIVARRHENAPPAEEIPLFHQVASQLKRTKYKNVLLVPNDVEDVEINDVWRLTWEGDDYIAHQDNDWGILIFATEHNLHFLSRHGRIIFVDGTFRSCAHPYNQIFTVHAFGL